MAATAADPRAETPREAALFALLAASPATTFGSLYDARYAAWLAEAAPPLAAFVGADDGILARVLATARHPERLPLLVEREPYALLADENEIASESPIVVELLTTSWIVAEPLAMALPTTLPEASIARIEAARAAVPGARAPLWVSHALGPRGRVLGDSIVVGAPAPWHDGTIGTTVALYLHESAVVAAEEVLRRRPNAEFSRWARTERDAIDGLCMYLRYAARPFATASEIAGSGVARDGGPTLTGARGLLADYERLLGRWALDRLATSDEERAAWVAALLAGDDR